MSDKKQKKSHQVVVAIACRRDGPNDRHEYRSGDATCDNNQALATQIDSDVVRYECTECSFTWTVDSGGNFASRNTTDTGHV